MFRGAIATGTHDAGKRLTNLSGQVTGIKLVTGFGEIKTFTKEKDPAIMQALRVSLGSMGVFTELTLKLLSPFYFTPTSILCFNRRLHESSGYLDERK